MDTLISPPTPSPGQPILPPGFRFHPTDEELVVHYLKKKAASTPLPVPIITDIDLYKFDPWDLPDYDNIMSFRNGGTGHPAWCGLGQGTARSGAPSTQLGKASFGEHEWYFFSPRDRKYPNGARPNRAAASGYWKATGTDKPITSSGGHGQKVGVKKALVFYRGRPPKGIKTNWIMHEYRLTSESCAASRPTVSFSSRKSLRLDDWVLCRIYKKHSQSIIKACGSKDSENSSCVEEVLASLPDVPDHYKMGTLPKIGSFGTLPDGDHFLESILSDPEASSQTNYLHMTHHQQLIDKYRNGMQGCDKPILPPMSARYNTFPCSLGSAIPKSECIDVPDAKDSTCNDDYLFGKSIFSLPNLTQKAYVPQPKFQLSADDLDAFYKWPLVARAN